MSSYQVISHKDVIFLPAAIVAQMKRVLYYDLVIRNMSSASHLEVEVLFVLVRLAGPLSLVQSPLLL